MSHSPTSSTVVGSEETSPTSTSQIRISPKPLDVTPQTEAHVTSSPTPGSLDKALPTDEIMASESSAADGSPNSTSGKNTSNSDQIVGSNPELGSTSPSSSPPCTSASEVKDANNSRSPSESKMDFSTSPLPAISSPTPNSCTPPVSAETQQQLLTSLGASPSLPTATTLNTSITCIQPITTDDLEEVMIELNKFERQQASDGKEILPIAIPTILEGYLQFVARGGSTHFPWAKVKWLFKVKLNHVISDFYSTSPTDDLPPVPNVDAFDFANVKEKVFQRLDSFSGIPFTIQRLAELLTSPKRHYRRTDKFMRALEKNMLIVSTVEPRFVPPIPDQSNQFPPPHHLPASLHSPTKSINFTILNGQSDMDTYGMKENEPNGSSLRLHEHSPTQGNDNGMTSLSTNTSPTRSLTALATKNGNNSSVLSASPTKSSNLSPGLNRSLICDEEDKVSMTSKDESKKPNHDVELEGFEELDEDDEEDEDDDSEDMELNVGGAPGDGNDNGSIVIQSIPSCSSDRVMGGATLDNTQFSISSSMEGKENFAENQPSISYDSEVTAGDKTENTDSPSTTINENRDAKKRKLGNNLSGVEDGAPNKVLEGEKKSFVGEQCPGSLANSKVLSNSIALENGATEENAIKASATNPSKSSGSQSTLGNLISSAASDHQGSVDTPEDGVAILKNVSPKETTFVATSTSENPNIMDNDDAMRSANITSNLQSNLNSQDNSVTKASDKSPLKISLSEAAKVETSDLGNTKTATSVNEIDSSIDKSLVLSSGDSVLPEKDEKDDSMEVDAECTGSESQIHT